MRLLVVGLIVAGWRLPLAAADVLISPPTPGLVELLTAIADEDLPAVQQNLDAHPELSTATFSMAWDYESQPTIFRIPKPGETFTWAKTITPLHFAAKYGRMDGLKALLAHGADIHQLDADGSEALVWALCLAGDTSIRLETVKLLLAHGADANRDMGSGIRPLHALMHQDGATDGDLIAALVAAGANIDAEAERGTPLMIATNMRDFGDNSRCRAFQALIVNGAEVNRQDRNGQTALIHLAQQEYDTPKNAVQILVENGADLSIRDKQGMTALDHACVTGACDGVKIALYPHYAKLPGGVQMLLFLLVVLAVGRWVWRHNRGLSAQNEAAWADRLGLPTNWMEIVQAGLPEAVPKQLQRRLRYERLLRWTAVPFAAGCMLTLMVFQDPVLLRLPTTKMLFTYAGVYIICYAGLFLRFRGFTDLLLAGGLVYSALGAFFLGVQGVVFWTSVDEYTIATMWFLAAALFFGQTVLMGWLMVLGAWMVVFERRVRQQCKKAMKAEEQTDIETRAGWDEGRSREK